MTRARQLYDEYKPVIHDFVYYDKTLPADGKNAYLAVVSLIHNHRRHDIVRLAKQKTLCLPNFPISTTGWTRRKQALKDPTCRCLVHAVVRCLYEKVSA